MAGTAKQQLLTGWIQMDIAWHDPRQNREKIEDFASQLPADLDILFLPEMFTTGFTMEPGTCFEQMDGKTFQWMHRLAARLDAVVAGSIVIGESGQYFNRFLAVFPDGHTESYNKRHLFNHAGEGAHYMPGQERKTFTWRGWRIMPQICYDLRFPVWSRNDIDYDLLVYVANWPAPRIHHWDQLLLARAIENQSYGLGVNRVGQDAHGLIYPGHSGMVSFDGTWMVHTVENEGAFWTRLDREKLIAYRSAFAFLEDRDTFSIQ